MLKLSQPFKFLWYKDTFKDTKKCSDAPLKCQFNLERVKFRVTNCGFGLKSSFVNLGSTKPLISEFLRK